MAEKSSVFDSIRIKSRRASKPSKESPQCEWKECEKLGTHRAPKTSGSNKEFHVFCMEHVRAFNKSFNYFKEEKVEKENQDAALHMAALSGIPLGIKTKRRPVESAKPADPGNLYARLAARQKGDNPDKKPLKRLMPADRNALEALGLKGQQSSKQIKTAYKELVKIHHPDANGGDKNSEERLRVIITSYTHLKQRGFL